MRNVLIDEIEKALAGYPNGSLFELSCYVRKTPDGFDINGQQLFSVARQSNKHPLCEHNVMGDGIDTSSGEPVAFKECMNCDYTTQNLVDTPSDSPAIKEKWDDWTKTS
jgi:hypothetical protein